MPDTLAPTRVPAYRDFDVTVRAVTRLSPHFVRVTFTGPDLELFGDTCLDQRIKVVLPLEAAGGVGCFAHFPRGENWYAAWRALPAKRQNPFRTYTVRAVRPDRREVDVDFVRHGDAGPASTWAGRVAAGDHSVLIGPDRRGDSTLAGVEWRPGTATDVLLVGDETAVPAISSILAALPAHARGQVFVEVPSPEDVLPLEAPAGVDVRWLPRSPAHAGAGAGEQPVAGHGDLLVQAVTADLAVGPRQQTDIELAQVDIDAEILWETPADATGDSADGAFAWLAGEAAAIRTLRRHLVRDRGWDRRRVAFMGYWRIGRSEA